nr:putative disease resistance protein [Quercus suber]
MSVIGEVALSTLFEALFNKLSDLLKIFQQEQVHADLNKWKKTLLKIYAVLDDAEEKRDTNRLVKIWLDELEDLAYDADDILDEFATEVLRRELNPEPHKSKVRKIFDDWVGSNQSFARLMQSKIAEIDSRLRRIVTENNDLDLRGSTGVRIGTERSRVPTTSLVNEDHTYGRDEDKKTIIKLLMSSEFSDAKLSVIPIVAEWAARGLCYRMEDTLSTNKQSKVFAKVRHFSYIRHYLDGIKRCLRVLSLCGYEIIELPSSIGDLIHLRYLNLSNTRIRSLPESTSSLYNLQTLMLKGCHKLTKLPEKIMDLANLRYLDITHANLIREMPVGIEKLKNLHTLSNFIVGKDNGSKIGDLMNLNFLRGRLCISSLENVLDIEDARRVNLNGKKNLNALDIKWGSAPNDLQDASIAVDVLDLLRPWTTVKELSIDGYIGVKFPTWLEDHSFSHIEDLKIVGCKQCISLPAIGHLSSLKFLVIKSMPMVQTIGPEFHGEGWLKPFQLLEKLHFEDMQEWQDWIPCGVEYGEFPCLRELFISQCPKLQGKLPDHLPSLEKFTIRNCEQLVVSIPSLPTLHKLNIMGCKEVVSNNIEELCLLESITFSIPGLKSLSREFMEGLAKVKNLKIDNCNELTSLWQDSLISLVRLEIQSCPSLVNIHLASTLNTLTIKGCGALNFLPMSNCTCLEYATIEECSSLMFISKHQLPPTLKRLEINNCENLQFLIDEGEASSLLMKEESINSNASLLEHLVISGCRSLKCVPLRGDLFVKLKFLEIWGCSELTSLSSSNQLPIALKKLEVRDCPKLESLADNLHNNVSLECLRISYCKEIKFLPEGLHKLCHLNDISIEDCCSLVSFPDGGFLPTHLTNLSIWRCEKLEALPRMHMVTTLVIYGCPSIVSLPEEGLPTNLKELRLGGMTNCKQVFEWGLHRLTSLTHLFIYGDGFEDWQSFPEEEDGKMMLPLPTSLTYLSIEEFPDIVFLSSKVFQNLSSLEHLWIWDCPKLASLPENGLPPSLLQLQIIECPVLKQHYKKGKGQEWLKNIINIPRFHIDGIVAAEAIFSTPKNSSQIPKIWRSYMMLWNMLIFRSEAMLEGKAVNASQVLNYYKHMVMICQEAMAGIHSLKSCKLLFASGHDFLIAENVKNKHTLLLPVLQQKLTSQLLKQHCKKGRG